MRLITGQSARNNNTPAEPFFIFADSLYAELLGICADTNVAKAALRERESERDGRGCGCCCDLLRFRTDVPVSTLYSGLCENILGARYSITMPIFSFAEEVGRMN